MTSVAFEIAVIFLLIIANGVFAMAELAVVSARKARLQRLAEDGQRGAQAALELSTRPNDFLSTVQIGITLVGVLAGAFGGATIAGELADGLERIPLLAPYSAGLAVVIVVITITYLTLVLGELAPKRLALNSPERTASALAPTMQILSRVVAPIARLLSLSAEGVLRLLGVTPSSEPPITEEEIKLLIEQGTRTGVFEPIEEDMVEHVFRLGDRRVSSILTPRPEIIWLDMDEPPDQNEEDIAASAHSRFPVARGVPDHVLGLVLAKDLLSQVMGGQALDLQAALRPATFVPENMPALDVLERFREGHAQIALVVDEYGSVQGLVTTDDIMAAIVGDIPGLGETEDPEAIQRADGSWLLDGLLSLDELQDLLEMEDLSQRGVVTVGGLAMSLLGRIPSTGEIFEWRGLHFEVIDMDGHRVDKLSVKPTEQTLVAPEADG